jgi:hypothetical protein
MGSTGVPNIAGLHDSQPTQTIMSIEESAIFEKEKGRLLDEITKVSASRRRCEKATSQYPSES